MADLGGLSDGDLAATAQLLAEQVNQLTIATELVRCEIARRRVQPDPEKAAAFNEWGQARLADAVTGAPQRAADMAEQAKTRDAAVTAAVAQIPVAYQTQARAELDQLPDPLDTGLVAALVDRFVPQSLPTMDAQPLTAAG